MQNEITSICTLVYKQWEGKWELELPSHICLGF